MPGGHGKQGTDGGQGQRGERKKSSAEEAPLIPESSLEGKHRHIGGWPRMAPVALTETLLSLI